MLEQLDERIRTVELVRAIQRVVQFGFGVEPEGVVHRRGEVLRRDWLLGGVFADSVADAVDLTAADSAAGHQAGVATRMMFATRTAVDLRAAAELADPDDQCLVELS